ncbi:MAG: RNase adapter RapZ [Kiloniellales bacterium]
MAPLLVHATTVALPGPGGPLGVLLRGKPGAGKSDLALRLIDLGARLIADDQTALERREGANGPALIARAPAAIADRLEVRGLGILPVAALAEVEVVLAVDLVAASDVPRLPEPDEEEIAGVTLPRLALDPFAASAPVKLRLALERSAGRTVADRPGPGAARGGKIPQRRLVLVTGLSGAGRSTALKALEDLGYEAIDNLPLSLLEATVEEVGHERPVAVGIDIRTRRFATGPFLERLNELTANPAFDARLLFLDCEDEVLVQRFAATRRRHPLAHERPVADGIAAERRLVAPLRERADLLLDTSTLNPGELKRTLAGHFGLAESPGMTLFVTSFSYRLGVPREADLLFDVRFLANPHYHADLRPLTGRDQAVSAFVESDPDFTGFFERLTALLAPLLPRYEREGKSYLTLAVGCTGGRHRSVAVAEKLGRWLAAEGRRVVVGHRDLARSSDLS